MKASLLSKLENLSDRHEEVSALLGDSEIIADQNRFRDLSREYSELEAIVQCYEEFRRLQSDLGAARQMLEDADPELREMARAVIADHTPEPVTGAASARIEKLIRELG